MRAASLQKFTYKDIYFLINSNDLHLKLRSSNEIINKSIIFVASFFFFFFCCYLLYLNLLLFIALLGFFFVPHIFYLILFLFLIKPKCSILVTEENTMRRLFDISYLLVFFWFLKLKFAFFVCVGFCHLNLYFCKEVISIWISINKQKREKIILLMQLSIKIPLANKKVTLHLLC